MGMQDEGLGGAGRWKLNMQRSLANLKTRVNLMELVYGRGSAGGMAAGGAANMEDDAGDDSDGDARGDDSDDEELFQVRRAAGGERIGLGLGFQDLARWLGRAQGLLRG